MKNPYPAYQNAYSAISNKNRGPPSVQPRPLAASSSSYSGGGGGSSAAAGATKGERERDWGKDGGDEEQDTPLPEGVDEILGQFGGHGGGRRQEGGRGVGCTR